MNENFVKTSKKKYEELCNDCASRKSNISSGNCWVINLYKFFYLYQSKQKPKIFQETREKCE